jgi:hypothetical protein
MSTLTIRLPDSISGSTPLHVRGASSLNKLVEEWATVALAQIDAEGCYLLRAAPWKRGVDVMNGPRHHTVAASKCGHGERDLVRFSRATRQRRRYDPFGT